MRKDITWFALGEKDLPDRISISPIHSNGIWDNYLHFYTTFQPLLHIRYSASCTWDWLRFSLTLCFLIPIATLNSFRSRSREVIDSPFSRFLIPDFWFVYFFNHFTKYLLANYNRLARIIHQSLSLINYFFIFQVPLYTDCFCRISAHFNKSPFPGRQESIVLRSGFGHSFHRALSVRSLRHSFLPNKSSTQHLQTVSIAFKDTT